MSQELEQEQATTPEAKVYILAWNGVQGRVLAGGDVIFEIDQKPKFSFKYREIYYDTNTGDNQYTTDGVPGEEGATALAIELNEEQQREVQDYCDNFKEAQDYMVHAYDEETIYRGQMLKSVAMQAGFEFVITPGPNIFFSKYNKEKSQWIPVYAVFKEDGYPVFGQERAMDSDILFMTKEEFDALPKQPSPVYSLDFKTMTWKDTRELDRLKFDAIMDVRVYFDHSSTRDQENGGLVNANEYATYITQKTEAEAWLKDDKVSTPFIDGFLSVNANIDKRSLCEKIAKNYMYDELFALGKRHGEMYHYIYRIKAASTNSEVDEVVQEVYEQFGKYRIVNAYRKYPVEFSKQVTVGTSLAVFTGGGFYHSSGTAE